MRKIVLALATATFAATVYGQQAPPPDPAHPALIPQAQINSSDSPLVQAAKRAVALRQGGATSVVIDDKAVAKNHSAHIAQASGKPRPLAAYSAGTPEPATPPAADPKRVDNQRKIDALKQEMQRMGAESEQPLGGDVEEDRVQQRLEQIPGEIKKLESSTNTSDPTPPPPQQ